MPENASDAGAAFCPHCGQPLRAGARFCSSCGQSTAMERPPAAAPLPAGPSSPPAPPVQPSAAPVAPAAAVPMQAPPTYAAPQPALAVQSPQNLAGRNDCQLMLQAVPPTVKGRVLMVLRQQLGLDGQSAQAYVAAAPVLLAVGLPADTALGLQAALAAAGAEATVTAPIIQPAAPAVPLEPKPEPIRRLDQTSETLHAVSTRPGLRTVTGLDIGHTYCYLAFARAEGQKLAAAAEMVNFEASSALPIAIGTTGKKQPIFGNPALALWAGQPDEVSTGMTEAFENGESSAAADLRSFLAAMAGRLQRVLMPGALDPGQGAATTLGVPAAWSADQRQALSDLVREAGFPVLRVVPQPLAALAHHKQQGTLRTPRQPEQVMMIDWGGTALRISFVEHGSDLDKPRLFEHVEHPLGGAWFEASLYPWLHDQIGGTLSEADQRGLMLFVRTFKEGLSKSFAEGRTAHAQYCVLPAGAPPTRIQLTRAAFEEQTAKARDMFQSALVEAVEGIGLKPAHLGNVVVFGGGGRWYFVREAVRAALGKVPLIGPYPEEVVARGLAVYGLGG